MASALPHAQLALRMLLGDAANPMLRPRLFVAHAGIPGQEARSAYARALEIDTESPPAHRGMADALSHLRTRNRRRITR